MKKRNLLLTLILAICLPWVANAQTVTIGTGTTTDYYTPIGTYHNYSFTEQIYTASEINQTGYILSLSFSYAGTAAKDFPIVVYMKAVSDTDMSTGWISIASTDQVFSGTLSVTGSGWATIELDNPFNYDGTKNLLIAIDKSRYQWYSGGNWNHTSASSMARYYVNDSTDPDPMNPSGAGTGTVTSNRPNVQLTFGVPPTCFAPQNLQATLTPGNGTIATLTWNRHASGTENAWVLQVATNDAFTANLQTYTVNNTPSKDLTGLTAEQTYYARVKPDCDTDGTLWSNVCEFTPTDSYNITLNDGTNTNTYVPIHGSYCDYGNRSQFIIPAASLSTLQWATLDKLTFYANANVTSAFNGAVFEVYMAEVSNTVFESQAFVDWATLSTVYNGSLVWSGQEWVFTLDASNPFTYQGGNLLIGFQETSFVTDGTYASITWLGVNQTTNTAISQYANSSHSWSGTITYRQFLPKVTIDYTPGTAPSCLPPTGLDVVANTLTAHSVAVQWDSESGDTYDYAIVKGTGIDPTTVTYAGSETASGTTCSHTWSSGLDADSDYTVFIRKNCGNGDYSTPATKVIHTAVACPAPVDFTAVVNGTSVTLSWTGAQSDIAWSLNASANPDDYIDPDFDIDQAHGTATMSDMALDTDYYFWVRTNCGGIDGTSAWVGPVSVHIGYCVPSFGSNDDCITNITLGDINNTTASTSTNGYGLYTDLSTTLEAGEPATLSLTSGAGSGYHGAAVWIDFNDDMVFDDDDKVGAISDIGANSTVTIDLTILSDATVGSHRMRVVYQYSTVGGSISPCASATYGEAEDYTVVIVATSCPTPSALNVTDLGPTSATLNWTSEAGNYYVRYRTAAQAGTASFFEDFENGIPATWTTIDSDEDGNNWLALSEISSVYTSYSGTLSDWAHNGSNAAASPSYANGVGCFDSDQWLITPQVNLGGMLKFYAASTYDDLDAFEVLLSTTGTAISDFTTTLQAMHDAPYALNDGTDDWEEVTIDLSSYSGQGYIAIHHVSNCMYFLVIDDFAIYANEPAGEWLPNATGASTSDNSLPITGLTPETEYEWQVMADCGEDGASNWSVMGTFTTPSRCMTPNGLNAEITGNTAQLTWIGGSDTYNLQYREVDLTEPATIILTAGDVWGDGSGYQMLLDADATAYDDGDISDYSIFEYLIPTDAEYDYNTSAVVFENSVSIQIPAGTYDWFITNPSPDWSNVYVAALDGNVGGRQDNYVFEAGKTYEFVPSIYGDHDGVDVTITADWTPVSDPVTSPYTFTGLTPNTTYDFQVQGIDCDGEGSNTDWSESAYFTTPEFYTKHIIGYNDPEGNSGYYLIASPIGEVNPEHVTNMLAPNYDLFYFDQEGDDNHNEWFNYKVTPFNLVAGKGYLYANSNTVDLIFTGTAYSGNGKVALAYNEDCEGSGHFVGWNLVGNPFAQTATIDRDCYVMNTDGDEIITIEGNREVAAMEGIFAIADGENDTITFSTTPINSGSKVVMNVMDNQGLADRAIVRFGEGSQLPKFQLFGNSTKVYFPKDDQDYAVVRSTNENELPVNFKASSNGTYTMSVNIEEIDMDYIHLIDNQTGMDVDLLQRSSYTFEATTSDSESRFLLVFATVDGLNENNFGFVNAGGNLCIYGLDGKATVQVIDMLGHVLSSEQFSGSYEKHLNVAPGVYMIRLIQGNDIKVQKMVVR